MGAPKKVGPFYQYPVFAVRQHDGTTFEFYTDKIYRVKTVGKIGYANLKMIFINEKTSQCYSRFVLFHAPENTKRGTQVSKHGQVSRFTLKSFACFTLLEYILKSLVPDQIEQASASKLCCAPFSKCQ